MVVVNDGFYKRTATLVPRTLPNGVVVNEWEYRFGHKIPFARTPTVPTQTWGMVADRIHDPTDPNSGMNPVIPASTPDFPVIIADTMNGRNINVFYPMWNNVNTPGGTDMSGFFGNTHGRWIRYAVDGRALDSIEGSAHHPPSIARELLRAMDSLMRWNAAPNSVYREGGELRIPAEIVTNFASENVTFVGPMVIAIADNFSWVGNQAMSFLTISNTQIVPSPTIYVYRINGNFMYSLCDPYGRDLWGLRLFPLEAGQVLPPRARLAPILRPLEVAPSGSRIWQVFSSEEAAALFGAYPDVQLAHLCS